MDTKQHINSFFPDERRRIMAKRLADIVSSKDGFFNESEYVNKRSKLKFRCSAGHEWFTQAQTVFNGSWCRVCWEKNFAGKHLKLSDGLKQDWIQISNPKMRSKGLYYFKDYNFVSLLLPYHY